MKLIFAGTPEFALTALERLIDDGFDVVRVLTQPDRPAGRGMQPRISAVKRGAIARGLDIVQPQSLTDAELQRQLRSLGAEALVVAAYGLLLPESILSIASRGGVNIHASLLPRWRGAAPIQRALLAGDRESGITIMQMDAGLDTGAVLLQEKIAIDDADTAGTLHDKLAVLGARCIVRALRTCPQPRAQDHAAATYAPKITRTETRISWAHSAEDICRQIRAFNPAPGSVTSLNGLALKIWQATRVPQMAGTTAGSIVRADAAGIIAAAGDGAVRIMELQKAGGKRLAAAEFLRGTAITPGARLGT